MVRHDYKCVSCTEVREYEHRMMEDPTQCSNCGSNSGLIKLVGAPNISTSKTGGSSNCLNIPHDPNAISQGVLLFPEGYLPTSVVREVARDLPDGRQAVVQDIKATHTGTPIGLISYIRDKE